MKILVTGGAGYIGSHACIELEKNGYCPIVLDDLSRGHIELVGDRLFYQGSLIDKGLLARIFTEHEIHAVMHFAAYAYVGESVEQPGKYFSNNVSGIINLLDEMDKNGIKRLIFSSTCAVYGNPKTLPVTEDSEINPESPYGESKYICERIINSYFSLNKIRPTIFRYFNVVGSDENFRAFEKHEPETHILPLAIDACIHGETFNLFGNQYETRDGTCVRDYIDVRDLVCAHVIALSKDVNNAFEDNIFNLGVGKGYTNLEILRAIENILNKKIKINIKTMREGDAVALYANPDKAYKALDWHHKYEIEDSIRSRVNFVNASV